MILKSLKLDNIRSYVSETIEFPSGTTLFEGDIGCGKSTILMAIEFALFGLGSERGEALLRKGEREGSVCLTFLVDGQEYTVTRKLNSKSKGSVQQDKEGVLKTPQGTYYLSPTELKEKILQLLGFNEPPDPKAQSLIYRYAVFTPQEEMKGIIFAPSDVRLQTLRKALRIEDYKIAVTNASLVKAEVREKAILLQAAASDIDSIKENIRRKEDEVKAQSSALTAIKEKERGFDEALRQLQEGLNNYQSQQVQLSEVGGRIGPLDNQLKDKTARVKELEEVIRKHEKRILDITPSIEAFKQKKCPSEKTVEQIRCEITKLEEEDRRLRTIEARIDVKIADYRSIEKDGICPTCDRPADPKEFESKITAKLEEKEKINTSVEGCYNILNTTRQLVQAQQDYENELITLQNNESEVKRCQDEIKVNSAKIDSAKNEIEILSKTLEGYRQEFKKIEGVLKTIEDLKRRIANAEKMLRDTRENVTSITTKIGTINESIEEATKQVNLKLEQKNKGERLKECEMWLDGFFIPTLNLIEKQVLANANQVFNQHFQRWFGLLVEDTGKEARVDETFTPIVEQDGYEQDVRYLSGGEKTSVALAYRLALNTLVQRTSTSMKSNLLILDEPTDGFSKEQLSKVKDILAELECPQVILVSHERELESFADQIFCIVKTQGKSTIMRRGEPIE